MKIFHFRFGGSRCPKLKGYWGGQYCADVEGPVIAENSKRKGRTFEEKVGPGKVNQKKKKKS